MHQHAINADETDTFGNRQNNRSSRYYAELTRFQAAGQQDENKPAQEEVPADRDELPRDAIDRAPGPVWLVAHSFGCLASVVAAADRPERVAGLMLVAALQTLGLVVGVAALIALVAVVLLLSIVAYTVLAERKICAAIQDGRALTVAALGEI